MVRTYGDKEEALSPAVLPDTMLTEIGRLIRAFAEIEDLINLYLCGLAKINESQALVLLGKTAVTRRLEMAEYLALMTGTEITKLHKQIFNAGFREALECRNAVAHGLLLGKTTDDRYAFVTAKTEIPTGPSAIQLAITYHEHSVTAYARLAEDAVPLIEKQLKLEDMRAGRLQRSLLPHRKAQPRREPSAKQSRQRRSSRAKGKDKN